ncbi:MAG TPA: hypothetical protein VFO54_10835 [Chryseosolibacter sp.]|nr:hypothetical protein [Chryseosolibacter sp.]
MIQTPKISDEQQNQLRYDVIKMINEYPEQEQLAAFRNEWDGIVYFRSLDEHTVTASVAGQEKLPQPLKEKLSGMVERFKRGQY